MNIMYQFTYRTLCKNKIRTLVTVIGIALSVAMFTSVTSIIVSMQRYLVCVEAATNGAWEGMMLSTTKTCAKSIIQDKEVTGYTVVDHLGYAKLEKVNDESKPYLIVEGISKNYMKYSPVSLVKGRMPKNAREIVISEHLWYNGGLKYQIGDTLQLKLGKRFLKGDNKELTNEQPYEEKEKLQINRTQKYTVVGICERPVSEEYFAAGYTAFTYSEGKDASSCDVFMTFLHPAKCDSLLKKYAKTGSYTTHGDLLRYEGNSLNDRFNQTVYQMGIILIGIIMIGSVSLIYNAFSISLSERTKQYGLLKSIGATKKQIIHSVLFECSVLCLIGIPVGLLAGLGGIGVTLHAISGFMNQLWASQVTKLHLVITWQSVVISSAVGMLTVVISAMIPAAKAVRIPAIQAIRQSRDIKIAPKQVKTLRIAYWLFGACGMLAGKNFKRNRKKYRTTVFSLFISIVLFVSATSFTGYMQTSTNTLSRNERCDVECTISDAEAGKKTVSQIKKDISRLSAVNSVSYSRKKYSNMEIPQQYIDDTFMKYIREYNQEWIISKKKTVLLPVCVCFIEDSVYQNYLEKKNLDTAQYLDADNLSCLYENDVAILKDKKVYNMKFLKKEKADLSLMLSRKIKGYQYFEREGNYCYYVKENADEDEQKKIPAEKASYSYPLHMGEKISGLPPTGAGISSMDMIMTIILPYSAAMRNGMFRDITSLDEVRYTILAKQHEKACIQLADYMDTQLTNAEQARNSIIDVARDEESGRALIVIISIFSYGFIVLISLISVANVFNTISSNVLLRRQEFAMLRSVGMTQRGVKRMMSYECMLYGLKSLLFGIPVSLLLSYLMYEAMGIGMEVAYMFPWHGILISAVNIFCVVFISMLYTAGKIRKDNPLETLRNENL